MSETARAALLILGSYLLGSIPFGFVLPRIFRKEDIRTVGSGNVGATNVFRVYGRWLGVPVALLDVLKGFTPALAGLLVGSDWLAVAAGSAAMLGHARPIWLRFSKGGKMVATAGGVSLALAPFAGLVCAAIWLGVFLLTKYASVASLAASLALPLVAFAFGASWPIVGFMTAAFVAVATLHRQNMGRLLAGNEPRFTRAPKSVAGRPVP
ncbi:MAG: glycerol-3-phosphate 1-O-acyltransferase PlsY [Gaiellales bacterium]